MADYNSYPALNSNDSSTSFQQLTNKSSMSDQLIPSFLPGAYYIRNKKTSKVLHIDKVYFDGNNRVLMHDQEVKFGNQQIWWIEPLPDYADKTEPTYFITSPGSRRALDVNPGACIASNAVLENRWLLIVIGRNLAPDQAYGIYIASHHGESWQRWKIRRINDDEGEQVNPADWDVDPVLPVD